MYPILIFNLRKRLVGIFETPCKCAYAIKANPSAVYQALGGKSATVNSMYVRYLIPDIAISINEDLGTLTLYEYDKMCNNDLPTYPTSKMQRGKLTKPSDPVPPKLLKKRGRPPKNRNLVPSGLKKRRKTA